MTLRFSKIGFILFFASLLFSSCYLDKGKSTSPTGDFVSFETDVVSILSSKCATTGCHTGTSPQGNLNLNIEDSDAATLYDDIVAQIDLDNPEESPLLTKASNTTPHTGGEVLATSSDDYQSILAWITDDAFNDNCDGVTHSFATDVTPIFTACNTAGCHDAGSADIDLATDPFQAIEDAEAVLADNPSQSPLLRKPLGLDEHTGGTIFQSKSDEDYKTIFCWIKEDAAADN